MSLKPFRISASAEVLAADVDADGKSQAPKFNIRAYGGGLLRVAGFWRPVVIDLAGLRAGASTPILLDHDRAQIVGTATAEIKASTIRMAGKMTGDWADKSEAAGKVALHAKGGFAWSASVGVVDIDKVEYVDAGSSVKVNGRVFAGPIAVARSGRLGEVSFVSVGADETASASIAASAAGAIAMTFEQWLEKKGFDASALKDEQKAALELAFKAETEAKSDDDPKPSPKPTKKLAKVQAGDGDPDDDAADPVAEMRKNSAAETRRIAAINKFCAGHSDIAAKAIEEGWTAEKAELEVLKAGMPKGSVGAGGGSKHQINADACVAALCTTYGAVSRDRLEKTFKPEVLEAASNQAHRGMTLGHLCYQVIAAAGKHARPGRVDEDVIRTALEADRELRASGFSTISLSGILSNVANKAMLDRLATIASIVPEFCFQTDTNDFKAYTRYRLDGKGIVSQVGADGELKHIELLESSFSNQLRTYGGMIALTRQMIINDDLGAFLQIPSIFAEQMMHVVEQIAIGTLVGNAGSFFSAGNKNYQEGAGTVFSLASLTEALKLFRELKNEGGLFISQVPDRLLVPPALEATAKAIYVSQNLNETTTANAGKPQANIHYNSFRPVVSPYLGTAGGLSGATNVNWWLMSNPASGKAPVQIGYLRGQRTPTLESAETDFNTLGMQWRTYFDFGCALFEPKSAVLSKGSA